MNGADCVSNSRQLRDWQAAVRHAIRGDEWKQAGRLRLSVAAYQRALQKWPRFPEALNNLALVYNSLGRVDDGIRCLAEALEIRPNLIPAQSNLLLAILNSPAWPPEAVAEAHKEWGRQFPPPPRSVPRTSQRGGRIRIGYVSSNFASNPESFFLEPLIRNHDRARFEIFCYSNVRDHDEWTRRYQRATNHWRDISKNSDHDAARRIRRDGIQILVDCTGHWTGGRLPLFSLKPAPLQVSFPTYPATTGLSAIDYRITDRYADPAGMTEHLHSEKLLRLPRACVTYGPPAGAPDVNPLPALSNGGITFGCFSRRHKITDEMLRVWAAILKRVPDSRLLFHHTYRGGRKVAREITDPILGVFRSLGVDPARISFLGRLPLPEHLGVIGQVDIALDTFPYHGMTMTCESLWMGVPVITLAGCSHVSRIGVSLLSAVGLRDFIAASTAGYIDIATAAAQNLDALSGLRSTLRDRMCGSPLLQAKDYARAVEDAYLRILARRRVMA